MEDKAERRGQRIKVYTALAAAFDVTFDELAALLGDAECKDALHGRNGNGSVHVKDLHTLRTKLGMSWSELGAIIDKLL